MQSVSNVRAIASQNQMEKWLDEEAQAAAGLGESEQPAHELDSDKSRKLHRKLLSWYYEEREKQAVNRYQMAIDHDFYDNLQWSDDDAQEVEGRGQAPLVFNEVAPMCDWLIGTERRTRVDWKVLPRTDDDVEMADVKTKGFKFLSDVSDSAFHRSAAFSDAIKGGLGWVDDGARNDPTDEVLYSRYESWRNVLHDSSALQMDQQDGRYLFRWRHIDLDVALAMFEDRQAQVRSGAVAATLYGNEDEDTWYLGQQFYSTDRDGRPLTRRTFVSTESFSVGIQRSKLKVIEGWFRVPEKCAICRGHVFRGRKFDPNNKMMAKALDQGAIDIVDALTMRMYVALFTEKDMLAYQESPYHHNRFPLTPIWCYRRNRDRMPYGMIRRARDVQEDLNKRMSKAQFLLSTNQIVGEEGAVEDWDEAREEVDRPDGVIIKRKGKEFEMVRNLDMGEEHIKFAQMESTKIQNMAGVNNENLGRQTNAVSGEAIKARQLQGGVVTTEPFDNYRYSFQQQGRKQLSLMEQFWSEPKVLRITGGQKKLDWVRINQPEVQPDGSVRWLNDITASEADFVISEQDFHGSLRQAMFESLMDMVAKMPPELGLRLLRIAFEYSDMPNKAEISAEIRKLTGEQDPNQKLTPEEQQQVEQAQQQQQQLMMAQQKAAELAVEEGAAKVRKLNAEADEAIAKAEQLRVGDGGEQMALKIAQAVNEVRAQAAEAQDRMAQQLVAAQRETHEAVAKLNDRKYEAGKKADGDALVARIKADAEKYVADKADETTRALAPLHQRLDDLMREIADVKRANDEAAKAAKVDAKADKTEPKPAAEQKPVVVIESGAIQITTPGAAVAPAGVPDAEADGDKTMIIAGPGGEYKGDVKRITKEGGVVVKRITIKRPDGKVYIGEITEDHA